MNKYNRLQSNNAYINYTLKNYLDCYEDFTEEDIIRLDELFSLLREHKFSIGNHLIDSKPLQGIKLDLEENRDMKRDTSDLVGQLSEISSYVDSADKKDSLFFNSIMNLCDSLQYLNATEMMDMNDFFQGMTNHKQSITDAVINDGKTFFYPYDRYPVKNK